MGQHIPGLAADSADALQATYYDLNYQRDIRGLTPLAWRPELVSVAAARVADMVTERYFAHEDPNSDPGKWFEVILRLGIVPPANGSGENLALVSDLRNVVPDWLASPTHLAIMLDPAWDSVGLAAQLGVGIDARAVNPSATSVAGWVVCAVFAGGLV